MRAHKFLLRERCNILFRQIYLFSLPVGILSFFGRDIVCGSGGRYRSRHTPCAVRPNC